MLRISSLGPEVQRQIEAGFGKPGFPSACAAQQVEAVPEPKAATQSMSTSSSNTTDFPIRSAKQRPAA